MITPTSIKRNYLVLMAIALVLGLILFGCKKSEQESLTPKIKNDKVETTATTATFTWTVDWPGKLVSVVEVSENEDMSDSQIYGSETETENHDFKVTVTDLKVATKYYYRYLVWNHHYVDNKFVINGKSFNTTTDLPKVKTVEVTDVTRTTATVIGEVIDECGAEVTERGVCWSMNHNPTTSGSHLNSGTGLGTYIIALSNLEVGKTYYVRAYAKNSKGTAYSDDELSFTTGDAVKPTVITADITNVDWRTATGGGEVTDDGDAIVTERGICWNTSHNPEVSGDHANNGTGTGNYTVNMTGLTAGTTYYVRAYAKNIAGLNYGNEVSFETKAPELPMVAANSVSDISYTSATCGGNVTSDGGTEVTERGVCWSTTSNPNINDSHLADAGNGMGSFTVQITGLTPNTSYYVCSYAINSVGISYGTPKSFATLPIGKPTITTAQVTNITQTSATGGGNVTDDGGTEVTDRGICWSTEHNPTLENCLGNAHGGTGTGTFTLNMTGLTQGTKYYVSAYATNSEGTNYGGEVDFSTTIQTYTINVSANPTNGGTVSGGGSNYQLGQNCTVTANAHSGYVFTNWTEDGIEVSTDASYTFQVTGNRTLVANYGRTILNEDFEEDLGTFSTYNVLGTQVWEQNIYLGRSYAIMNCYSNGAYYANEDWLISPSLNVAGYANIMVEFCNAMNFEGAPLRVMVSTDYNEQGNPNNYSWIDITSQFVFSQGNHEWTDSGQVNIGSIVSGSICYIAFVYTSSSTNGSIWEIDYVKVLGR